VDICETCEAGKYASSTGFSSCSICPSGKYNPDPASNPALHATCEACLPGKFNDDDGNNILNHDDFGDCRLCDAGTFSNDNSGALRCTICQEGISPAGASSCSTCPVGNECVDGVVSATCPAGKYSNGLTTRCEACPAKYKCPGGTDHIACTPGSYSASTSQAKCTSCEPGKFQPDEAKNKCDECTPGHFCPASSSIPISCDTGSTFQPDTSAIKCKICMNCAPGYEMSRECTLTSDRVCSQCAAGKFSLGAGSCKACQEGEYSSADRTGCIAHCNPGEIPNSDDSGCDRCSKGKYAAYGAGSCIYCDNEGEYADYEGSPICKTAPAGHKPSADRTSIEICPKNTFSIGANTACTTCPPGAHSQAGASACERCRQYETFSKTDSLCACEKSFERINDACSCKAGETLMGTSCQPCERGKWKSSAGVEGCSRCEETLKGSITVNEGSSTESACKCPKGAYDANKGECVPVVEGMSDEVVGMTLQSAQVEPGFWRTGADSSDIRECPKIGACIGGNSTQLCGDGHTGHYCSVCIDGYTKDSFSMCHECAQANRNLIIAIATVLVLAGLVAFLVHKLKKRIKKSEKSKNLWKKMRNGLKVIFASAQITAGLPKVIPNLDLPKSFEKAVDAMSITNLNFFAALPFGCWYGDFDYYNHALGMIFPVIISCGLLTIFGIIFNARRQQCFTVVLAITYLTLPSITTIISGLFPCEAFDDDSIHLRSDYQISCER